MMLVPCAIQGTRANSKFPRRCAGANLFGPFMSLLSRRLVVIHYGSVIPHRTHVTLTLKHPTERRAEPAKYTVRNSVLDGILEALVLHRTLKTNGLRLPDALHVYWSMRVREPEILVRMLGTQGFRHPGKRVWRLVTHRQPRIGAAALSPQYVLVHRSIHGRL